MSAICKVSPLFVSQLHDCAVELSLAATCVGFRTAGSAERHRKPLLRWLTGLAKNQSFFASPLVADVLFMTGRPI